MNKIININLAGRLIPINESAYKGLNDYINKLKQYFSSEENGHEIVHDMEDRIGELLEGKINRGLVSISEKEVAEIKGIIGMPEEIADEAGHEATEGKAPQERDSEERGSTEKDKFQDDPHQKANKQFCRSRHEKVVGGVCSGIGAYFNIDPVIIRILFALFFLFWGIGLLVYLILWIILPEKETTPTATKGRWYRSREKKVIGGVCGGIATHLNIDPVWLRLIFILPVLLGLGGGFWPHFSFSYSFGGFPAMILLYIILWMALPTADTLTEKLEMSGQKVDVKNIKNAIQHPQPNTTKKENGFSNVLIILLKIFLIFVGVVVLLVLLSIALGLITAFFGIGVAAYGLAFPLSGLLLGSYLEKIVLTISLILIIFVPAYLIIYFLIRLLSDGKRKMKRWWSTTLIVLFLLGVFGIFGIAGTVLKDFKAKESITKTTPLPIGNSDTLTLTLSQKDYTFSSGIDLPVRVKIKESKDSLFRIKINKSSRGKDKEEAMTFIKNLSVRYQSKNDTLFVPNYVHIKGDQPYRVQKVKFTLFVPRGKYIYIKTNNAIWWGSYSYRNNLVRFQYDMGKTYEPGLYIMTDTATRIETRPSGQ